MEISQLSTEEELSEALAASKLGPVLLFKHSLTCPISSNAYGELKRFLEADGTELDVRMIVVQNARPVSNQVESVLGVQHESPQAIVVREGKAVWSASHFKITSKALSEALRAR